MPDAITGRVSALASRMLAAVTWTAFGPLASVDDLLAKLRRDLARMKAAPGDIDPVFDFYVTALHMLDWRWPTSPPDRAAAIASNPDLAIVAHLGNQAKHYVVNRHHAVDDLDRTQGAFQRSAFQPDAFQVDSIDITLPDGTRVDAIVLAERVVVWWASKLTPPT